MTESRARLEDNTAKLWLMAQAADLEAAQALKLRVVESLRRFGQVHAVNENHPPTFEPGRFSKLGIELGLHRPALETRDRLLEALGNGWRTKVQVEIISETEVEETQVATWDESRRKKHRFAFPGVFGAELLGPSRICDAEVIDEDESDAL